MALDISKVLEVQQSSEQPRNQVTCDVYLNVVSYQRLCVKRGAPTPAGISMFKCENFVYTREHEVKHKGDMGMGHLWLIMGGAFMA